MSRESRIGVFVLIALAVMGYFVYRTSEIRAWFSGESKHPREVAVVLDDASGIRPGTSVEIAGVKIGEVDRIELEGESALAMIRIPEDMVFREGALATMRSKGVLGDRYLALNLGKGETLPEQTRIKGSAPPDLGQITSSVNELARNMVDITNSLKASALNDSGGNRFAEIAANMERVTAVLAEMLKENRADMRRSSNEIASLTSSLNRDVPVLVSQLTEFSKSLREMAEANRGNLNEISTRMAALSRNFEQTSVSFNAIAAKVNEGQGTIGKLINEPDTANKVNEVLDNVNASLVEVKNLIGKVNAVDIDLSARSEYLSEWETTKTYVGLKLQPNPDKYYLIEGVSLGDELLIPETKEVTETVYDADGNLVSTTVRSTVEEPKDFVFNGQLAYKVGPIFVRGGVLESEGGGGIDWYDKNGKVKVSFEAFDFSRKDLNPHGRFDFRYRVGDHINLNLGWDDLLESTRDSAAIGAGIRWKDDDLKLLFSQLGKFR